MCNDYKEFDINLNNNKCWKIDCPYLYLDWEDYEYECGDGTTDWESYEINTCDIRNSTDMNSKCPIFGFTKTDNFKVNYKYLRKN